MIRPRHLWLTLSCGAVIAVVTLSGTAVIFKPALDRWCAGVVLGPTAQGPLDPVAAALAQRYPDSRLHGLERQAGLDLWHVRGPAGDSWITYTEAGTGIFRGDTQNSRLAAMVAWTARFHRDLWWKPVGEWLVGLSGVALASLVLTGLILWWRSPSRARLRWRHPRLRWYDGHRWLGIIGTVPLLWLAGTGVLYSFPGIRPVVHRTLGGTAEELPFSVRPHADRPRSTATTGAPTTWDSAVAATAHLGLTPLRITPPRGKEPDAIWTVILDHPGNRSVRGGVMVALDRKGAAVLATVDPRGASTGGWLLNQLWGLHTGTWGGWPTQVVQSLVGILPVVLLGTGLLLWWRRRKPAP